MALVYSSLGRKRRRKDSIESHTLAMRVEEVSNPRVELALDFIWWSHETIWSAMCPAQYLNGRIVQCEKFKVVVEKLEMWHFRLVKEAHMSLLEVYFHFFCFVWKLDWFPCQAVVICKSILQGWLPGQFSTPSGSALSCQEWWTMMPCSSYFHGIFLVKKNLHGWKLGIIASVW